MQAADDIQAADIAADLALLVDAAQEAGEIALRFFKKDPEVWMKGGNSPVSEADYAVDAFLRKSLLAERPDYGWLSEETVDDAARLSARRTFVVDPIDGTRGFLEGNSRWCVSAAVVELGRTVAGVLECPARSETFVARRGGGAFRNGRQLAIGAPPDNLKIGGPKELFDSLPAAWRDRSLRAGYIPSLAYRIALVAEGSLDATFVKPNSHDWDLAAAELVLREAGGSLLDARGDQLSFANATIRHGALVAGSGQLLATMSDVVAAHYG